LVASFRLPMSPLFPRTAGWWIACLGVMAMLCPARLEALDPERSVYQYNCRTWRRDNGLPTNGVNALAVSRDGRLWLGTSLGLLHFDGIEFRLIEALANQGIAGHTVTSLASRDRGGVWFGLDYEGTGYFDGRHALTRLPMPMWAGQNFTVRSVAETRAGELLVSATSGAAKASGRGRAKSLFESLPGAQHDVFAMHGKRRAAPVSPGRPRPAEGHRLLPGGRSCRQPLGGHGEWAPVLRPAGRGHPRAPLPFTPERAAGGSARRGLGRHLRRRVDAVS
jgi:hypothetical protein